MCFTVRGANAALDQVMLAPPTMNLSPSSFAKGLALGLATAGVAFVAFEAIRRARAPSRLGTNDRLRIDGVRPLDPLLRATRPDPDGGAERHTLASEIPDVPPQSQRW